MKRKNATRRALFTSMLSLLLCVTMFVGTTFAWFTDEVKSGINTITAGNLDVELYHSDKAVKDEQVKNTTTLFDDVALWEPGAVAYENLQVKNVGNLALKYQMALNFTNATKSPKNNRTLADVLKVAVVEGGFTGDREAAKALDYKYSLSTFALEGELEEKESSETYGIVIYWAPGENDNDFNMNNEYQYNEELNKDYVLKIDLGISLFATQLQYEEDSFDETYDKDAELEIPEIKVETPTADAFLEALRNGETAVLTDDMVLDGEDFTLPAGVTAAIDLNGHTLTLGDQGGINVEGNLIVFGDGEIEVSDNVPGAVYCAFSVETDGTLEIQEGVTINVAENATAVTMYGCERATLNLNGGIINVPANSYGIMMVSVKDADVNLNTGKISGEGSGIHFATYNADIYVGEGVLACGAMQLMSGSAVVTYAGEKPEIYEPTGADVTLRKATDYEGIYQDPDNAKSYTIDSKEGLMNLYQAVSANPGEGRGDTITLTSDIDMAGETWQAVDTMWMTFDGNGHTIKNLTIAADEHGQSGLFAYAGHVTIKNLTLENVTSTGSQAGAFIANAEGCKLENCKLAGDNTIAYSATSETHNAIGALIGWTSAATLENVEIAEGATVTLIPNGMTSKGSLNNDFTGYGNAPTGTATNNGTIIHGISNATDLMALGGTKINGTYVLLDDIDLNNATMKSMEISGGSNVVFNGNKHTISNLVLGAANIHGMTGAGNEVAGLFDLSAPATTVSLTVSDLTVKNANVSCSGYAAVIAGYNSNAGSTITLNNVDVIEATINAETVAALVGYTTGVTTLTDCDVSALSLTGEAGRADKVGAYVGTANTNGCVINLNNCTNTTEYNNYGRAINGAVVKIDGAELKAAASQDELNAAVVSGNVNVTLAANETPYTMPSTNGNVIISGTKETVIKGNDATAKDVTFNGVTIQSTGNAYTGIKHSETVVYNGVDIIGNMYLYAENVEFNNCHFDLSETSDYIWIYGATNVTFNKCTFDTMGKAILVFQDGSKVDQTVIVEGCTFEASAPAYNYDKTIHIAAVSIDGSQGGTYKVILNNNVVDEDFYGLWQDKTSAGNITVTVDGTEVLAPTNK